MATTARVAFARFSAENFTLCDEAFFLLNRSFLAEMDKKPITVKRLVSEISPRFISQASAYRLVNKLIDDGLLTSRGALTSRGNEIYVHTIDRAIKVLNSHGWKFR